MAVFTANVSGVAVVKIPLTANLTDLILLDGVDAQIVTLEFVQDGTGSRTVASLSSVGGLAQPVQAANAESFQRFIFNQSINIWQPIEIAVAVGGGITQAVTASGAITAVSGYVTLGGAGVDAMTLVAPPSDGIDITFLETTAHAHTITTPANKIAGGFAIVTFASGVGNMVRLTSSGGLWFVVASQGITLS